MYPRTTNKILRAFLIKKGVKESDIDEKYTPFGHSDYQTIVADIKKFAARRQDRGGVDHQRRLERAVLQGTGQPGSEGDRRSGRGILGRRRRTARTWDTKPLVGHLAAWNYFMSIKNPVNDAWK